MWKRATNAVIAGCRPEYYPVILATDEGMLQDEFGLRGILSTTHPCRPVIMVYSPIADELEINYGVNTMGQGFRANSTIGRAISLIAMNVGGAVPGQSDDATHGGPHKKEVCFAENEKRNPWEPLNVDDEPPRRSRFSRKTGRRHRNCQWGPGSTIVLSPDWRGPRVPDCADYEIRWNADFVRRSVQGRLILQHSQVMLTLSGVQHGLST